MARNFRYGTALTPTVVKDVIGKLPNYLQVFNPREFDDEKRKIFSLNLNETNRFKPKEELNGKYPSVSAIISSTSNLDKLYNWQMKMISQLGFAKFKQWSLERMRSGTDFHITIQKLLNIIKEKGQLTDNEAKRIICSSKFEQNIGYCQGILPIIQNLKSCDWMCMEKKTTNHFYCYQGRFDAIIELDGEPTLVDWKTASSESVKSTGNENTLENQYGNPIQIVAYISSVNSDPAFEHLPKIKRGAIVLAFEDGRPAEIIRLGEDNIQEYTDQFAERLNQFWWKMEHPTKTKGDVDEKKNINFVYNPALMKEETKPNEDVIVLDSDSSSSEDETKKIAKVQARV